MYLTLTANIEELFKGFSGLRIETRENIKCLKRFFDGFNVRVPHAVVTIRFNQQASQDLFGLPLLLVIPLGDV